MAVRRFIVDSGGTSRFIRRRFVVDSGGTARLIKRRFVIDSGGTARLTYQGDTIVLNSTGYTRFTNSPASFRVDSDGNIYAPNGGTTDLVLQYAWFVLGSAPSDYEVRVDATSGSFSSGTTATWLSLASDQTWTRQSGAGTFQTVNFDVQIRRASDAEVLATASVGLTCDRT